jgi:uncharacterized protein
MRLRGIRRSSNVSVRRGGGAAVGGGLGVVGVLAVLAIGYFTGIDVTPLLNGQSGSGPQQSAPVSDADDAETQFAARVLTTTEDVWGNVFDEQLGADYQPPQLVIFSGATRSGCGGATAATGPFYCPSDRTAYLDTEFFALMDQQLGAEGDFAAAYVIAHEVAHHVQNLIGVLPEVEAARQQASQAEANALTVRLELMADCFAGIWAARVQGQGLLEEGDIDEALNAARRIGDDYLQKKAGRTPQPETFTHGTSEQRSGWFARGFETGQVEQCDTFAAREL